jgi:hypothetical protein
MKLDNIERNSKTASIDPHFVLKPRMPDGNHLYLNVKQNKSTSVFYFYNPTTVAFGKIEFKKHSKGV